MQCVVFRLVAVFLHLVLSNRSRHREAQIMSLSAADVDLAVVAGG